MENNKMMKISLGIAIALSSQMIWANSFEFDRPGTGLGTGIVPKGQLAWEQGLPTASYDESRVDGVKQSHLVLQGDTLLRLGVGSGLELRLGWDGPIWQQYKNGAAKTENDGVGDIQIGVKKAIDLKDEKLKWALLAQVHLATGDDEFTTDDEIYTLASVLSYQFDKDITTGITMSYDYQDSNLAVTAVPSISYPIAGNLSGFSEYVFRKAEHQHYQSIVNTGLLWSVSDRLQLDATVGYSFNQQAPDYTAGLGLAYLF